MVDRPPAGPRRTATVSVLFCDLVGSTERQTRTGDDANDEFRRRFLGVLREAVARCRGEEVKNTGDGLMVVFRHSALDAVACAVAMHEAVESLDADAPVQIYVGISAGEAADDAGDWFGTPVNEAARLCAAARPGQTLTNEVVRSLVGSRGTFAFRSIGPLTLKGLPGPIAAVEVVTPIDEHLATPLPPPDRRRRRTPLLLAAIVVVIVVVAGTVALIATRSGPGPSATQSRPVAVNYPISYTTAPCSPGILHDVTVAGLECGTLTVPEDRTKPHGRVVHLGVMRAPARETPTGDPVIDFGADTLATSPARDHSDELQLAERGTNYELQSDPALTCPEYAKIAPDALTKPAGDLGDQHRDADTIHACYERWTGAGVDLNQYNYLNDGRDIADLIRALHYTHVHLVSGYVETIGALEVIRELPGVVRSLTLQEPVAPGQSSYTDPPKYLSEAFNSYISLCQADPACKTNFPDLTRDYRRDHDQAALSPRVLQGDDGNGHRHAVLLDGDRVAQALSDALGSRQVFPLIAAALAAPPGNTVVDSAIAGRVIDDNAPLLEPDYPWGAVLSERCAYEAHTVDQTSSAISRQTLPQFATLGDDPFPWQCASWPVQEIDPTAFDDPATTVPTLIVNPLLGPGGDPQWADIFERGLPNATALTFPTLDGSILQTSDPPCFAALRRAFLADPTKPIDGAACEGQGPPIQFLASLGG